MLKCIQQKNKSDLFLLFSVLTNIMHMIFAGSAELMFLIN